jgi:hypothetical protein
LIPGDENKDHIYTPKNGTINQRMRKDVASERLKRAFSKQPFALSDSLMEIINFEIADTPKHTTGIAVAIMDLLNRYPKK